MDLLHFEEKYWSQGLTYIAGIDEAGRGPLAGPVVASAVIFPKDIALPEVNDSKKISEKKRERLFDEIIMKALSVGVGVVHENEIDTLNILQATYKAMKQAVEDLSIQPEILLVDGRKADIKHYPQENIIKGDSLSLSIAAASIIAKVTRDRIMRQYDKIFPLYGFSEHKGYGTQTHINAIEEHYASPIHRKSFKPIKENVLSLTHFKENKLIGRLGEQLVACHMIRQGYSIHEMNFNVPKVGEVDVISKKSALLIFTQVKTQTVGHGLNEPRTQIDDKKQIRIMNAAQLYMDNNDISCEFRFDVAEVILGNGNPQIEINQNGLSCY